MSFLAYRLNEIGVNITGHRSFRHLVVASVLVAILYRFPPSFDVAAAAAPRLFRSHSVNGAPAVARCGCAVAFANWSGAPKDATLASRVWFFGGGSSLSGGGAYVTVDHRYPGSASRMAKKYSVLLRLSSFKGVHCSAVASILVINDARRKGSAQRDEEDAPHREHMRQHPHYDRC